MCDYIMILVAGRERYKTGVAHMLKHET